MPYDIFEEDGQFWVYKTTEDGAKGERKHKKPYKTRARAENYMKALFAAEQNIHEMESGEKPALCFLAPLGATPELVRLQKVLRAVVGENAAGNNFLDPDEFHITLCYATGENVEQVVSRFEATEYLQVDPVFVSVEGMSVFDTPDGYAVHLMVQKTRSLEALQTGLTELMRDSGYTISPYSEAEQYKPHITLAYLTEPIHEVEFQPFELGIHLIELSGGQHEALVRKPLRGGVAEMNGETKKHPQALVRYTPQSPDGAHVCRRCAFWQGDNCAVVENTPEPIVKEGHCSLWTSDTTHLHVDRMPTSIGELEMSNNVSELDGIEDADLDADMIIQEYTELGAGVAGGVRVRIREIRVHEMKGQHPAISLYPVVDERMLTEGDSNPFWLYLPISQSGRVSENQLSYDDPLVRAIATQLQGLGGIRGHIPENERSHAFPIEDVDWVGHAIEGNTLWARGYVPPGATREYVRRLKARGGKLSTSIYGDGVMVEMPDGQRKLTELSLEAVDLAPAKRAALKLGGEFAIVREMRTSDRPIQEDENMDEKALREHVAQMNAENLAELIGEEQLTALMETYMKRNKKKMVAAEMVASHETAETLIAELKSQKTTDTRRIAELETEVNGYRETEYKAGLQGVIDSQFKDWKNLDKLDDKRRQQFNAVKAQLKTLTLAEMAGKQDLALATAKAAEIMGREDFRPVVEMLQVTLAGGNAIVGGENNGKVSTEEAIKQLEAARRNA